MYYTLIIAEKIYFKYLYFVVIYGSHSRDCVGVHTQSIAKLDLSLCNRVYVHTTTHTLREHTVVLRICVIQYSLLFFLIYIYIHYIDIHTYIH